MVVCVCVCVCACVALRITSQLITDHFSDPIEHLFGGQSLHLDNNI